MTTKPISAYLDAIILDMVEAYYGDHLRECALSGKESELVRIHDSEPLDTVVIETEPEPADSE